MSAYQPIWNLLVSLEDQTISPESLLKSAQVVQWLMAREIVKDEDLDFCNELIEKARKMNPNCEL